ncbi:MAG: aspartate-semialdehyde dehydrogenase [Pseudomonadota bacterium]
MKKINVAVVGATGAVGETMISILQERNFPVGNLYPLASERSLGQEVSFNGERIQVHNLDGFDFTQAQIALFSAGASISAEYAPKAVDCGAIVIDNTSQFRYEEDIPLVVPEVNPHKISDYKHAGIIANPNCSTIQMVVALKPIHDYAGISRINVATYQSVSGTGKEAMKELNLQTTALEKNDELSCNVYSKQIAFNVLPHIDIFMDNGYTKEEMKMVWETQKIFEDKQIMVNATTVRVPVYLAHSEAIHIETKKKITVEQARDLMMRSPGIKIIDTRDEGGYPTAVTEGAGTDDVYVGRIREDISHPQGLNMWVVSDNLRKGAALNTIQIAEELISEF